MLILVYKIYSLDYSSIATLSLPVSSCKTINNLQLNMCSLTHNSNFIIVIELNMKEKTHCKWSGSSQCHICTLQRLLGHFLTPK